MTGDQLYSFEVLGNPVSKANSYRAYSGGVACDDRVGRYAVQFRLQCRDRPRVAIDEPFGIELDVYFARRGQDLDNAFKAILDNLQELRIIKNDNLCYAIEARKYVDPKNPRVRGRICRMTEVTLPGGSRRTERGARKSLKDNGTTD